MTTQQPMTLEDRLNAIINNPQFEKELCMRGILLPEFQCDWHTFGGFDGLPEKYKAAILATEARGVNAHVIPLEEVAINVRGAIMDLETMGTTACMSNDGPERLISLLESALHHLEAGRRVGKGSLRERTLAIINDIAEGIDNKESRAVLRETIAELADERMHITEQEHLKRMDAQTEAMLKLGDKLQAIEGIGKECECEAWENREGRKVLAEPVWTMPTTISFCPWCGGKVSSTTQP